MMTYLFQGRFNVAAESQGRLQVTRLWERTDDAGVRDMLSFLIARETMHQNQWLAAIEELEADGLDAKPCPMTFPQDLEYADVLYQFWNCSEGTDSQQGRWAGGRSVDGRGEIDHPPSPGPLGPAPELGAFDPRLHGTPRQPTAPVASGVDD